MEYDDRQYRTKEWFESLKWQRPWIEKMAGWWVGEYGRPGVVYDFGAGDGWWCKSFHDMGATAYAVELDEIAKEFIPPQVYPIVSDLRSYIAVERRADIVLCLEVIEHLPKLDVENNLLKTLTDATGDILIISAAQPGQEGTGHINLQPLGHWIDRIERFSYIKFSSSRTAKAKAAFQNITNEGFHFLARNLAVFARI
jgi:hypothetical protein